MASSKGEQWELRCTAWDGVPGAFACQGAIQIRIDCIIQVDSSCCAIGLSMRTKFPTTLHVVAKP
jgi:hypothetical protein